LLFVNSKQYQNITENITGQFWKKKKKRKPWLSFVNIPKNNDTRNFIGLNRSMMVAPS